MSAHEEMCMLVFAERSSGVMVFALCSCQHLEVRERGF